MKYVYYNVGIAPAWTFDSFHEKVYMAFFWALTMWTTRNADEVKNISRYAQTSFIAERKLFFRGNREQFKKYWNSDLEKWGTKDFAGLNSVWWVYYFARNLIRFYYGIKLMLKIPALLLKIVIRKEAFG